MESIKGLLPLAVLTALAVFAAFVLSKTAKADELHVMELRELSMDYGKLANYRDPYYASYVDPKGADGREAWNYEIGVNWTLDLLKQGDWGAYATSRVHGASTDSQFRAVGYQFEVGLQLGADLQLYYDHHSQHVLDRDSDGMKYPLYNSAGVRYVFYRRAAE